MCGMGGQWDDHQVSFLPLLTCKITYPLLFFGTSSKDSGGEKQREKKERMNKPTGQIYLSKKKNYTTCIHSG